VNDRGVILVNPDAGDGTDPETLRRAFEGHRVVECRPEAIDEAIDEALAGEPASFVAMAGGDGSMRALASALRDTDVPMLAVPEGTRNHLARDLGIHSVDDALGAARGGQVMAIDLGAVDGEVFVNNLSIGTYPAMVRDRKRREMRWPKAVANLMAAVHQMRRGRRSQVEIDEQRHEVWSVFVGNGRYGTGLADLTSRDDLADGALDVRIVTAGTLGRTRVVIATLFGRLDRSPFVVSLRASSLVIDSTRPTLEVALDGEVTRLDCPLHVQSLPGALRVLVPRA
jgi:diacylglycerol kinase family enzyme